MKTTGRCRQVTVRGQVEKIIIKFNTEMHNKSQYGHGKLAI